MRDMVAIVELSDLLCRMGGLNHGYIENRQVNLLEQTGFAILVQQFPQLKDFDWARLTFELDSYLDRGAFACSRPSTGHELRHHKPGGPSARRRR